MHNRENIRDKAIFRSNDLVDFQSCYEFFPLLADSIKQFYKKSINQLITISRVETKRRK